MSAESLAGIDEIITKGKVALVDRSAELLDKIQDAQKVIGDSDFVSSLPPLPNLPPLPPLPPLPSISPSFTTVYDAFCQTALGGAHPPAVLFFLVPLISLTVSTSFTPIDYPTALPYGPKNVYSPSLASKFYSERPFLVLHRIVQLVFNGFPLGASLFVDKYITKKLEDEPTKLKRAKTLLTFVENNGCTYIKIGQAASVREDIIDSTYAKELSQLQDRVPPFDSTLAKSILTSEIGSISSRFTKISDAPVASASIGQVYKATTVDGKEVAVKVQRPNVVNVIALDLHIVRTFAPIYQKITKATTDLQALADEWGRGFIAELNYENEAINTKNFQAQMAAKGLTAVTSPTVVDSLSSSRILTTEWVDGTRLDRSTEDDVTTLCAVALNAYLVMLLETGTLHCDPHPGNLLRTSDGKLCILDWGMTLHVQPDLQLSLLEFISHLTSKQYDEIPTDFVKLDFLKAEKEEFVRASGFLEPLTYMLKQAGQGGGGKKVRERIIDEFKEKYPGLDDEELREAMQSEMKAYAEKAKEKTVVVGGISAKVSELQAQNKDAFSIPEWFLYTSRAFLTLEGICLQSDEDFSIINSCFPYVAKRLLSDDSERARVALKNMVYGASASTVDETTVVDMLEGFESFERTSKTSKDDDEATVALAREGADLLLGENDNVLKEIVTDVSADAITAQLKHVLANLPFTPPESKKRFLKLTESEEKAASLIIKLSSRPSGSADNQDSQPSLPGTPPNLSPKAIGELASLLREYGGGGASLASKLTKKVAEKNKKNIEDGLVGGGGEGEGSFALEKALSNVLDRVEKL